jgi:ABC-type nitrate/sulfonate/bicarbonate transport system permease component
MSGDNGKWRYRFASIAIFSVLWEVAGRNIDSLLLPTCSETVRAIFHLARSPEIWQALRQSNEALILGYAMALLLGIPLGIVIGSFQRMERMANPYLTTALVTPTAALMPLVIIAVGLNLQARAIIVFFFSFPYITATAQAGMHEIDRSIILMARSFCATRWQVLINAALPAALPAIMLGARVGLGRAITGMIIVELVLVSVGLGRLILRYQGNFQADYMYGVVIIVLVEAVLLMKTAEKLERWASPWVQHND